MATADPLDEFSSELASAKIRRPTANPPSPAPVPAEIDHAVPNEYAAATPQLASAPRSPMAAPLLSLEEIVRREVPINWDEAVAVIEEVCVLSAPVETGVPAPSDLFIADGTVARRDGARVASDVSSAGRLLHSLLSTAGSTPVPLRLFVTQASAQGTYASIAAFAQALAYFGKAGRRDLIRALYLRCATAATSMPATVRPADPKPEVPTPVAPQPARKRPTLPRWAVAMLAAVALSAAGLWVWSMRSSFAGDALLPSLVAQAREAIGSLGIGTPADQPAPVSDAAPPPELKRGAGAGSRLAGSPSDAPRLISRAIGSPAEARSGSRRRPRALVPVLVQPPTSAQLSARSGDETERETVRLTIYSGKDADVEPPLLLHPQIPTNLMLAGEDRLNIMELLISETGSVERVHLVAGPSRLPDVMLLSGAKAWRFKPASRDGEAVRYRALVSWAGTP